MLNSTSRTMKLAKKAKPKNKIIIRPPPKLFISGHLWKPPTIQNRMPEPVGVKHMLELNTALPPMILEVACKQGVDPENTCLKIQKLRDMIYERGGSGLHRMDDDHLERFLRSRFWKVEHAYKLMCRYYQFRESNVDLYKNVNPMTLRSLGDDNIMSISPYRDQQGRRVLFFKFGNWRPSKVPLNDLFKATLLMLEVGSLEPVSQVVGGVGIMDLEGLSLNHAWQLSPSVAQKTISLLVTCMPIQTKEVHIVNQGWVFDAAFQVFKPGLNDGMRKLLFIHGTDRASLHKHIDPAYLPERYGGTKPEYSYTYWLDYLCGNEKVVHELEQLGYVADPASEE